MLLLHLQLLALAASPPVLAQLSQLPLAAATGPYTPALAPCPANFTLVRRATGASPLAPAELAYTAARKADVLPAAWKAYLANAQAAAPGLPPYVADVLGGRAPPTLALAVSGGGYRAALFGAGVLNALDARNASAARAGTGGLLQAATYAAGLSGGAWLLTSLVQAELPPVQELVFGAGAGAYQGWLAGFDVLAPSANASVVQAYVGGLLAEIAGKWAARFPVSVTDVWARALARHFVNGTTADMFFSEGVPHGAGITFSGLRNLSSFASRTMPFPVLVANLKSSKGNASNIVGGEFVPLTNPLMEFTVYEMGSHDPVLAAFTPMEYLGTQNTSVCVTGFDQAAFIAGTSSDLFNEFNTSAAALASSPVGPIINVLGTTFPQSGVELDTTPYPNPFMGVAPDTFIAANDSLLTLVDGGEDGEVMAIQPLLVKERNVDVIFAIDANGDVNSFSTGTSLIATANRTKFFPGTYPFPPTPSLAEIAAENLTTRPTFFGCESAPGVPLLVYLANGGPPRNGAAPLTNTSTLQLSYGSEQLQRTLDQVFDVAVQGLPANKSSMVDEEWAGCLACAVVDRARNRSGVARSGMCVECLNRYCWNGSTNGVSLGVNGGSIDSVRVNGLVWFTGLVLVLLTIVG